jgi:hypothetical protein
VYINGSYYANRYFGENAVPDHSLAAEIASVIEYVQYKERGTKITNVLLFEGPLRYPGLSESLSAQIEIPVIRAEEVLNERLFSSRKGGEISRFLDAYGATIRVPHDLDIRQKKEKKYYFRRFVLPAVSMLVIAGGLAASATITMDTKIQQLRHEENLLNMALEAGGVSEERLEELERHHTGLKRMLLELSGFRSYPPPAYAVLNAVHGTMPSNTEILELAVNNGSVRVRAGTDDLSKVSAWIVALRGNICFSGAKANIVEVSHSGQPSGSYALFDMTLELNDTAGGGV